MRREFRDAVSEELTQQRGRRTAWEPRSILLEALAIAAVGLTFSLVANLVSPRGLSLARSYFPGRTGRSGPGIVANAGSNGSVTTPGTNSSASSGPETAARRLGEEGLQVIGAREATQFFGDPQYAQELIVFLDARDDHHYQEGHIPGAYQFDRYYPEKHLPTVLPACMTAVKVVVYCTGGNCEDSEFAALALKDAGVPQERLFVYLGGMNEWAANGRPVEVGERKSGNLRSPSP